MIPTDNEAMWHDLGKLAADNEIFRGAYEWLYFDFNTGDGNQMSLAFLGPNPFDPLFGLHGGEDPSQHVGVTAHMVAKDDTQFDIAGYLHGRDHLSFTPDPYELRIGKSSIRRKIGSDGLPIYNLSLNVSEMESGLCVHGELEFRSVAQGWMVPNGVLYQKKGVPEIFHRWVVHVPRAKVSGHYVVHGGPKGSIEVTVNDADGYHDHNYGTVPMDKAIAGWFWARGFTGNDTVILANLQPTALVETGDTFIESVFYVASNGRVVAESAGSDPKFNFGRPARDLPHNKMPYETEIEAVAPDEHGNPCQVVLTHERVALDEFPFYLRRMARLELVQGISSQRPSVGRAVAERMDLGAERFEKWYLLEIKKLAQWIRIPPPPAPAVPGSVPWLEDS